jgi:hypothetical protein
MYNGAHEHRNTSKYYCKALGYELRVSRYKLPETQNGRIPCQR